MCTPNLNSSVFQITKNVFDGFNLASDLTNTISSYQENKTNLVYRTQIAINNANQAKQDELRQRQLGIEESRLEKIAGLNELSKLKAQNSASGLDISSKTNQLSYQDILDSANTAAKNTKFKYNKTADKYMIEANEYLNQANVYKKQYDNYLLDYSFNALGKVGMVSNDWFDRGNEVQNGLF